MNLGFDADGNLLIDGPAFGPDGGAGQGYIISVDPSRAPTEYADSTPEAMAF